MVVGRGGYGRWLAVGAGRLDESHSVYCSRRLSFLYDSLLRIRDVFMT